MSTGVSRLDTPLRSKIYHLVKALTRILVNSQRSSEQPCEAFRDLLEGGDAVRVGLQAGQAVFESVRLIRRPRRSSGSGEVTTRPRRSIRWTSRLVEGIEALTRQAISLRRSGPLAPPRMMTSRHCWIDSSPVSMTPASALFVAATISVAIRSSWSSTRTIDDFAATSATQ
jgi:hypothetical protein